MNLLVNKYARSNYEIIETFEAGIKLLGWEVKSLRAKHGSIKEAYISQKDEVFLVNAHLPLFQPGHKTQEGLDPYRPRKLLLHKNQMDKIREGKKQKGLTLIPLRIYAAKKFVKVEIAIARGKQQHDKRRDLKDRTSKREAERAMKELY